MHRNIKDQHPSEVHREAVKDYEERRACTCDVPSLCALIRQRDIL